ncbi:MAG: cytochrome P450 [Myxococcales bacterium]|nr:cytochrome P450 [Myxococcales bacterium]
MPVFGGPWWPRTLQAFRKDPLGTLMAAQQRGPVVRLRMAPMPVYLISEPEHVEQIMQTRHHGYSHDTPAHEVLRLFLGTGLTTSDGEFWRRQRRLAQPAFRRDRIAGFATTMSSLAAESCREWRRVAQAGATVDMAPHMYDVMMRISAKTLLSVELHDSSGEFEEGVSEISGFITRRVSQVIRAPLWLPLPRHLDFRRRSRRLDEIVLGIIEQRRRADAEHEDLLAMLMSAKDAETGEAMTDRQLRDEVLTMLVAGHETTANAMIWTLYLIARHPEVLDELVGEYDRVLDRRPPTLDDVSRLTYARRVIMESLRLYPPSWSIARTCKHGDTLGEHHLRPKSMVLISPWVTHRCPHIWPEPTVFDPDRFTEDRSKGRPRYAHFPFGGGPRQCIGKEFALLAMQIILASMLSHVRPELAAGHRMEPEPHITLRARHGLRMQLHPR